MEKRTPESTTIRNRITFQKENSTIDTQAYHSIEAKYSKPYQQLENADQDEPVKQDKQAPTLEES